MKGTFSTNISHLHSIIYEMESTLKKRILKSQHRVFQDPPRTNSEKCNFLGPRRKIEPTTMRIWCSALPDESERPSQLSWQNVSVCSVVEISNSNSGSLLD